MEGCRRKAGSKNSSCVVKFEYSNIHCRVHGQRFKRVGETRLFKAEDSHGAGIGLAREIHRTVRNLRKKKRARRGGGGPALTFYKFYFINYLNE
jgi:hypothetical protein